MDNAKALLKMQRVILAMGLFLVCINSSCSSPRTKNDIMKDLYTAKKMAHHSKSVVVCGFKKNRLGMEFPSHESCENFDFKIFGDGVMTSEAAEEIICKDCLHFKIDHKTYGLTGLLNEKYFIVDQTTEWRAISKTQYASWKKEYIRVKTLLSSRRNP